MKNHYWYQAIKDSLRASDTVIFKEYPLKMHYNITMMAGFMLRYNISRKYGVVIDVNYTQLKAENVLTFAVDPPPNQNMFPDIRLMPVRGIEKRVHLDLLLQRNFLMKSKNILFPPGRGEYELCTGDEILLLYK